MKIQPTTQAIVEDIRAVARKLGVSSLSRAEYLGRGGRYSEYSLYDGGRTWEGLCTAAGVKTKKNVPVPDAVYFQRLQSAVAALGRLPKSSERKRFGLNFRKRRWPTLNSFIDAAVKAGVIGPPIVPGAPEEVPIPCQDEPRASAEPHKQAADTLPLDVTEGRLVPPIPAQTKRRKWERTGVEGFPYAPQDEQGVVALFAVLCSQGRIPWQILDLNAGKGIDAVCYDDEHHRELRVELKYILSESTWNHSIEDVDYVVCWDNRWKDFPRPVIELGQLIQHRARR